MIENGLVIGAVYAAVAFGMVLIYRSSGVLSFAQAETGTLGAFVFYVLWIEQDQPYVLAAAAGVALSALVSFGIRTVLRPIERRPIEMLIATLGFGAIILFVVNQIWGGSSYFMPPPFPDLQLDVGPLDFAGPRLLVLVVAAVTAVAFFLVFRFTRWGLLLRAVAQDPLAARLVGVNVGLARTISWVLAGALAGLAGILVAPLVSFQIFFMNLLIVRALTAGLLARMTSLPACLAFALGIGVLEAGINRETTTPGVPELVVVCLLVVILVVRGDRALTSLSNARET